MTNLANLQRSNWTQFFDGFYDLQLTNSILGKTLQGSNYIDSTHYTTLFAGQNATNEIAAFDWRSLTLPSLNAGQYGPQDGGSITNLAAYTTTDNPTNAYVLGTVYTSPAANSWIQGSAFISSSVTGSASIVLNFTNAGIPYQLQISTGLGIAQSDYIPFGAFYMPPSSTFSFVATFGSGASGYITNAVQWRQP